MTTFAELPHPQPCAASTTFEGLEGGASDASACQAAAHATRLAIARWRLGQPQAAQQVAAALRASAQERWYAQTLLQLDAWRASGGFGQDRLHKANDQ